MLDDRLLDGFNEVLPDVPAVGDMDCVRGADPSGLGVGDGAVAADHLDARMVDQPLGHRRSGPVGQQFDRLVRLDVDQDRAVVVPLAQSELIDSEDPRRVCLGFRQAA
ncbi:hypothetical protein ABKA17_47645 [Streptomyces sp. RG80]